VWSALAELVADAARERVPVAHAVGVVLAGRDCVTVGDAEREKCVADGEPELLGDAEEQPEPEGLPEALAVAVPLPVAEALPEAVAVALGVRVALDDAVEEPVAEELDVSVGFTSSRRAAGAGGQPPAAPPTPPTPPSTPAAATAAAGYHGRG
jgi:hypothetical protein